MTPLEIRVGICVVSLQICALSIILRLALAQLKALRRDVIAAGIDIHQALVEANVYHRLASMASAHAGASMHHSPGMRSPEAEEDPEQWLERMRTQQAQNRRA